MNILIVYAHDEPSSLTATLKNTAAQILQYQGHTVTISDLFTQGFAPLGGRYDFVTSSGQHYNYQSEQQHAARNGVLFSVDIKDELQKLQQADVVLWCFPLWWHSAPAMMKGWFDRIMVKGVAWEDGRMFEHGLLRGKAGMLAVCSGDPLSYYDVNGKYQMTMQQTLHHINHGILALSGMNVMEPFVAHSLTGATAEHIDSMIQTFKTRIDSLTQSPLYISTYS